MTGRERILCVLQGGIPDQLPWTPLLNEYFLSTLPHDKQTDDPVVACRLLEADIIDRDVDAFKGFYLYTSLPLEKTDLKILKNGKIKYKRSNLDNIIYQQYETPVGTLTSRYSKNKSAGDTLFHEEMLVKKEEDLRTYQYFWEAKAPYPVYHLTQERTDYIGEDGIVMVTVPCTPILQLIQYDLGLEKFTYFLKDYPLKMKKILNIMEEKSLEACKIAVSSPVEAGIIPENSGTLLVSPKQFLNFCAPILSEYGRIYQQHGKYLFLHACGHLHGLLKQIAAIQGLSGIGSLTTPPLGDVELEYAKKILKNMTIIGGLNPVQFFNSTPDQVESTVKNIIKQVKPGRNFILMPSDSTPASTPIENFYAVNRTIKKYGQWKTRN